MGSFLFHAANTIACMCMHGAVSCTHNQHLFKPQLHQFAECVRNVMS